MQLKPQALSLLLGGIGFSQDFPFHMTAWVPEALWEGPVEPEDSKTSCPPLSFSLSLQPPLRPSGCATEPEKCQPVSMVPQGAKDVTTQAWVETVIMTSCFDLGKSIREATGDDSFIHQPSPVQANNTQPRWETEAQTEPRGPGGVGPISPD